MHGPPGAGSRRRPGHRRSIFGWANNTAPRLVIAPDKFKGSLSAREVAAALAAGWRVADGGEGTVAAFLDGGAQARRVAVRGPLGEPHEASFALDGRTAIVESALA